LIEYVAGNAAWVLPEIPEEDPDEAQRASRAWPDQVASLDCALLGLLSETAVEDEGIEEALDDALVSSLWARSIARRQEGVQAALRAGLANRARLLWSQTTPAQRRGYYLAGVGLATGRQLDAHAEVLNQHLSDAEAAIVSGDDQATIDAITAFASIALTIRPFVPKVLPRRWEAILEGWLQGKPVSEIDAESADERLEFIEETLAYKLPWAMEAVRVRAAAHNDADPDPWSFLLLEPDQGFAVAAVETGTLSRPVALLMRAGLPTRSGALAAVALEDGRFETLRGLHQWLNTDRLRQRANDPTWPTPSTHDLWTAFVNRSTTSAVKAWRHSIEHASVLWLTPPFRSDPGAAYRAVTREDGQTLLETPDGQRVGRLLASLNPDRSGLLMITGTSEPLVVELSYRGPADLRQ
jgi:hypothetical protein